MIASSSTLRTALRAADVTTLDAAIGLVVYYIKHNHPYQESIDAILAPISGDEAFNQRINLVKMELSI